MNRYFFEMLFICFMMTFFLSSVSSAVMEGIPAEELAGVSEIVVEGEVKNVVTHWSKDRTTIITRAVIINRNTIKGRSTQRQIIVEYDGGEIGDIGLKVSDMATLTEGERVILFLTSGKSKWEGNVFHIVGKGQGKYTVGDDGIARKGGFSIIHGEDVIDNNIPVDVLIDKIRKAR